MRDLKKLRFAAHMPLVQLAHRSGVNIQRINMAERGLTKLFDEQEARVRKILLTEISKRYREAGEILAALEPMKRRKAEPEEIEILNQ